jgi:hypothetical protein
MHAVQNKLIKTSPESTSVEMQSLFHSTIIKIYRKNGQNVVFIQCCPGQYSQSGNDQDEMVEIKKSRVSCNIFSIFMNSLMQWRKSDAGLAKPNSDLFQTQMLF